MSIQKDAMFTTYNDFYVALKRHEEECGVLYVTCSSKKLRKESQLVDTLKYEHAKFVCKQGQRTRESISKGIRPNLKLITSDKQLVQGTEFHYEQTGRGKHTVLLLPGALGSSRTDFLPQLNGLSTEKYWIIAFDPRGYGKSRPPDRDWPLMYLQRDADDVALFMKTLGIPRYSVLGWSDGGITGLILAANHPGNIQRLLIWGSNAFVTEKDLKLYKAVEDINTWSPKMRQPFIEMYGEEYFKKQWKAWNQAVQNYYIQRNGDICIGSLPNIRCPTLIVNGLLDPLVPQEHPVFLQKHIPNCRTIEWPEGKHNLHLRYPQQFNAMAEEFLDAEIPIKV